MEGEINNPQAKPECCHLNKVGSFVLFLKKKNNQHKWISASRQADAS